MDPRDNCVAVLSIVILLASFIVEVKRCSGNSRCDDDHQQFAIAGLATNVTIKFPIKLELATAFAKLDIAYPEKPTELTQWGFENGKTQIKKVSCSFEMYDELFTARAVCSLRKVNKTNTGQYRLTAYDEKTEPKEICVDLAVYEGLNITVGLYESSTSESPLCQKHYALNSKGEFGVNTKKWCEVTQGRCAYNIKLRFGEKSPPRNVTCWEEIDSIPLEHSRQNWLSSLPVDFPLPYPDGSQYNLLNVKCGINIQGYDKNFTLDFPLDLKPRNHGNPAKQPTCAPPKCPQTALSILSRYLDYHDYGLAALILVIPIYIAVLAISIVHIYKTYSWKDVKSKLRSSENHGQPARVPPTQTSPQPGVHGDNVTRKHQPGEIPLQISGEHGEDTPEPLVIDKLIKDQPASEIILP